MRTLVLGAAISGRAAAELARRLGHEVDVYDARASAVADLRDEGYPVHSGSWAAHLLDDVDLVVTSPGFPESAEPIQDALAAGVPLVSEIEFAARELSMPLAAVTGTNGKTTVTKAAAAMLERSGLRAVAAGNVGTALSSVVGGPWDAVVVEASSFQLRFIDRFHPESAAILNLAPDHLDWHGDFASYAAAKGRIADNQTPDDVMYVPAGDAAVRDVVAHGRARVVEIGASIVSSEGFGADDGRLVVAGRRYALRIEDPVYRFDLAVAAAIALDLGANDDGVEAVVDGFSPGRHRREVVGSRGGVTWVNDSKATNPHAAVAAASSYPSVVLIAGGRNKALDLAAIPAVRSVRKVLAIGEAAPELAAADPEKVVEVGTLEAAVASAAALARSGDTVLLAPGCASFDMFDSYEQRGERFAALVAETLAPIEEART